MSDHHPTVARVDLGALRENYQRLRDLAGPEVVLLPVIKADAYGHGMKEAARTLRRAGARRFAVSDVAEGIALREAGIRGGIHLLEPAPASAAGEIVEYGLIPVLGSLRPAEILDRIARRRGRRVSVHVKVDTGMTRLGVEPEGAEDLCRRLARMPGILIEGIFTHFPLADTDRAFTRGQVRRLQALCGALRRSGIVPRYVHAANSFGLAAYRFPGLNLARPGIMLYGIHPVPTASWRRRIPLRPVLSVHSRVLFVKRIPRGRGVGYGHTFTAPRDMILAVVPIGYSDGYLRALSNTSSVLIAGRRCPVVGAVTMDQILVDADRVSGIRPGTPVTILGREGRLAITAEDLAREAGTIPYEIVCNLGNRLPRRFTRSARG